MYGAVGRSIRFSAARLGHLGGQERNGHGNAAPDLQGWELEEARFTIRVCLIFSRVSVLNFFPVPVEEECNALHSEKKGECDVVSRHYCVMFVVFTLGICLNAYECRIQGGKSSGSCALGFGVCCVCK